ncbi:MAG TPA: UrcA family protein [Caulobacteraceae bacterium]|jgi:UrcA family protein
MSAKSILTAMTALAAVGFAGAAQPALAQDRATDPDAVSVNVAFADLNLSSHAGAKVLLQRIHQAAKQICGEPDRSLARRGEYVDCMKTTTDRAVASVNSPLVTAMYSGKPALTLASTRR